MSFFNSISEGIKRYFDKREEERLMMQQLQKEADTHRLITFKEEFGKNAKIVAEVQARKDAAKMSGLQKLRATSRVRNLQTNPQTPGSFFEKLSSYTQKNIAEREKNLARTEEMRKIAKQESEKRLGNKMIERKPFSQTPPLLDRKSTWKP